MSQSDPILVIQGLAGTAKVVKERLDELADQLTDDPEAVAALLARWDAGTLSRAFGLAGMETAAKVAKAIAEARFDEQ